MAALAAAAAFAVPLLTALHTVVPGTRYYPLFEPKQTDRLVPVEIPGFPAFSQPEPTRFHKARLVVQDAAAVASHQRILLTVATHRTVPRLYRAELSFAGTACTYHAAGGADLADNYPVVFERDPECSRPEGATGTATLLFYLRNEARIALVSFISDDPPPPGAFVVTAPEVPNVRLPPILVGTGVDVDPRTAATRIQLLAYLWNVGAGAGWIDAAVVSCALLGGCAVFLAWPAGPAPRAGAAHLTVAAFLAAFALSAAYAVVCPPFQVADEPSHFQVLTGYAGRPALAGEADAWARRNMFEEIRFNPYRPFSALDRGGTGRPPSLVSLPARDLYGAVRLVWRPLTPLVRGLDLPHVFLTVRLFHAAVYAAGAALFVLLVRRYTGSTASAGAALPLFLVPALPQFGMHVSNYAPLIAAYTVIAAGVVIAYWDGPRSWTAGPILGLGLGAAIGMSRSTLALLPMIAAVLGTRALLGDRDGRRFGIWAFWIGFTLSLSGMLMLLHAGYTDDLHVYGGMVSAMATAFLILLREPWLLLPFGAAGLMGELLLTRARATVTWRPSPTLVRDIALAAAITLFVVFAASLFVPYPVLPLYPVPQRPGVLVYVSQAVLACATVFRFGRPDWLTSATFFAGFGWLDLLPPVRLVSLVAGASGVALILLLVWTARARSTRALIWISATAAGFVASAGTYALSVYQSTLSDLHGRYLIGLYLCALAVCWTGPGRAADPPSPARSVLLTAAAFAGGVAVHVYSLRLILFRYFS